MDSFYVITNMLKDADFSITRAILRYLEAHGKKAVLAEKDKNGHILPGTIPEGMDCALVLGGDGTLIRAAREIKEKDIPLLGINLGTLGFLAEVELSDIYPALDKLFLPEPDVGIERRMMMCGTVEGITEDIALNDIVVARDRSLRVVQFDIYVNGELLNSYQADGVIVSTPTGSTAYNLSAGGPVVEPTSSMFVITPICSHALNTSSIVLSAEDVIEIEIREGRYGKVEHALAAFDGTSTVPLKTGDRITIQKAERTTKLIKLSKESFMKTMREKMKGN